MVSQSIWIAIVIVVFFAGMGGTYLIFHTGSSDVNADFNMMKDDQHAQEMGVMMNADHNFTMEMMSVMLEDPALQLQMIGHMAENPEAMQQMMKIMNSDMTNSMMNDPEMQELIMTTMHDSNQIQLMEDMMEDMMERMKTDPELKQAMMEHMEHMENMKSSGDSMMGMNP